LKVQRRAPEFVPALASLLPRSDFWAQPPQSLAACVLDARSFSFPWAIVFPRGLPADVAPPVSISAKGYLAPELSWLARLLVFFGSIVVDVLSKPAVVNENVSRRPALRFSFVLSAVLLACTYADSVGFLCSGRHPSRKSIFFFSFSV